MTLYYNLLVLNHRYIFQHEPTQNSALQLDKQIHLACLKPFQTYFAQVLPKALETYLGPFQSIGGKGPNQIPEHSHDARFLYEPPIFSEIARVFSVDFLRLVQRSGLISSSLDTARPPPRQQLPTLISFGQSLCGTSLASPGGARFQSMHRLRQARLQGITRPSPHC